MSEAPLTMQPRVERAAASRPDRRQAILLAAERLFAERGFHAVSMRDIATEAGVPVALVSYHYGSKQALYRAIFESWLPSIGQRRAGLDAVMAAPAGATLGAVLRAYTVPLLRLQADPLGQHFARMASRDMAERTPEAEALQQEFFDPLATAYIDAFQQLYPGRPARGPGLVLPVHARYAAALHDRHPGAAPVGRPCHPGRPTAPADAAGLY